MREKNTGRPPKGQDATLKKDVLQTMKNGTENREKRHRSKISKRPRSLFNGTAMPLSPFYEAPFVPCKIRKRHRPHTVSAHSIFFLQSRKKEEERYAFKASTIAHTCSQSVSTYESLSACVRPKSTWEL